MSVISDAAKNAFLTGQLDWSDTSTDVFMAALIFSDLDVFDEAAFAAATDVGNLAGWSTAVAAEEALTIEADGAGTALVTGGSTEFSAVPPHGTTPTTPITGVIVYVQNSGLPVALINDGINLGVIPNGGSITIYWNNNSGVGEVFRL